MMNDKNRSISSLQLPEYSIKRKKIRLSCTYEEAAQLSLSEHKIYWRRQMGMSRPKSIFCMMQNVVTEIVLPVCQTK